MVGFRFVKGVTHHFWTRLPEWANAIILLNFGLSLVGPPEIFEYQSAFTVMLQYATLATWGWVMISVAAVRLVALSINGTFRSIEHWSIRIRAGTATICCLAWFLLSLGLYLGDPRLPGWKTYAAHLVVDMIIAIHLGGLAGRTDRDKRNGRG